METIQPQITGSRTAVKFNLVMYKPMTREGYLRFRYTIRSRVRRQVFKGYGSHKDLEWAFKNASLYGVPCKFFSTDQNIIEFLCTYFNMEEGATYRLQGFKKKGFSSTWCYIIITNKEKMEGKIQRKSIGRYFFRNPKNYASFS